MILEEKWHWKFGFMENRFVGMKSRGVYETPGGSILLVARRAVEV